MITKFKIFENEIEIQQDDLKIGDWVICNVTQADSEFVDYVYSHIGCFVGKDDKYENTLEANYMVMYKNVTKQFREYCIEFKKYQNCVSFYRYEIKYWSPNKEDCEAYMMANKYNL